MPKGDSIPFLAFQACHHFVKWGASDCEPKKVVTPTFSSSYFWHNYSNSPLLRNEGNRTMMQSNTAPLNAVGSQNGSQRDRKVSFKSDMEQIVPMLAPLDAADDDFTALQQQLWYTKPELSKMRKEVANVLIQRAIETATGGFKCHEEEQDHPELWGLERHCLERDQSKKAAVKLVLLAQHLKDSNRDPEFLRSVSLQCSKKARDLAADQGFRDSCHVYYEDSLESLVDDCISDCMDLFPSFGDNVMSSSSSCKRSTADAGLLPGEHERRVRSRHVSAA